MTKKHFIELADCIKANNAYGSEPFSAHHIDVLANFCKEQNYRFDRERWLGYIAGECGKNGGTVKTPKVA
jgi:hypothetical protein